MITFKYKTCDELCAAKQEDRTVITKTTAITLPEIIEEFEHFLLAVGYVLPKGAHLGYEYDETLDDKS